MKYFNTIREYENLHIALWLLKDTCWVMLFKIPALCMIIPTILVAIYIAWHSRKELSDLWHNIAICCWICANSTWMIGEFFFDDTLRPYAIIFFLTGISSILFYYAVLIRFSKKT